MARRNQNTFIKRQKEIERVRKAKEKMDRRHGKRSREEDTVGITVSDEPSQGLEGEGAAEEPSQDPGEDGAAGTSPDH